MHRESSVFIDYVSSIMDSQFLPNFGFWEARGLEKFLEWKHEFYRARDLEPVDLSDEIDDASAEIPHTGATMCHPDDKLVLQELSEIPRSAGSSSPFMTMNAKFVDLPLPYPEGADTLKPIT